MALGLTIVAGILILIAQIITYKESEDKERKNKIIENEKRLVQEENLRLTKANNQLNKKISKFTDQEEYFNSIDFNYLEDRAFPRGFTVFRQRKNEIIFKKIYGKRLYFDQYDVKIIQTSKDKFSVEIYNIKMSSPQVGITGGTITRDKINPKEYNSLQLLNPVEQVPNMVMALCMIEAGDIYTFAVGLTPLDRKKWEKENGIR
ncbi:hypothetical protein [Aquimarina algiphila]|uniref:hypothetical protein n=1 Tax=Aquimarina algiphila TaxID=2047982 RepID=UPI0024908E38|nr:hypothetical protein [Aquimarina algiphila]